MSLPLSIEYLPLYFAGVSRIYCLVYVSEYAGPEKSTLTLSMEAHCSLTSFLKPLLAFAIACQFSAEYYTLFRIGQIHFYNIN